MKHLSWNKSTKRWVGRYGGSYWYYPASGKTNKHDRENAERAFQSVIDRIDSGESADDIKKSQKPAKPSRRKPTGKHSIARTITRYLEDRERDVSLGKLTGKTYRTSVTATNFLLSILDPSMDIRDVDESTITKIVGDSAARITANELAQSTVSNYMLGVSNFIRWCWKQGEIRNLPRNISNLQIPKGKFSIAVYSESELNELAKITKGTMNELLFMLALNCGYNSIDIATLKPEDLVEDNGQWRLRTSRVKTGINTNHVLWAKTKHLMDQWRNDDADTLFTTTMGYPLVSYHTNSTRNSLLRYWSKVPKFYDGDSRSFRHLRKSGATLISRISPLAERLYLGHSAKSVADKHYVLPGQAELDDALRTLERTMAFTQGNVLDV